MIERHRAAVRCARFGVFESVESSMRGLLVHDPQGLEPAVGGTKPRNDGLRSKDGKDAVSFLDGAAAGSVGSGGDLDWGGHVPFKSRPLRQYFNKNNKL